MLHEFFSSYPDVQIPDELKDPTEPPTIVTTKNDEFQTKSNEVENIETTTIQENQEESQGVNLN